MVLATAARTSDDKFPQSLAGDACAAGLVYGGVCWTLEAANFARLPFWGPADPAQRALAKVHWWQGRARAVG